MNKIVRYFKESALLRAVTALIISIIVSYFFYSNGKVLDQQSQLFDLKLAITLILVEVPSAMFAPIIARLIINEHEKQLEATRLLEKKHNAKKLNDDVFRKLVNLVCLEYYPFFENKLGFCIPKDPAFFKDVTPADIGFNIQLQKLSDVEKYFDKIEDVIRTLEVGEDYLKQNYAQIYDSWVKIKQELEDINKDQQDFCNKVSNKIMNDFKKHFHVNPTLRLIPHESEFNWAYFSDVVPKTISLIFNKYGNVDFSVDSPFENQFYVNFGGYRMIGVNNKEKLDLGTIKGIFNEVANDDKLVNEHRDFSLRLIKLNNKIETFRNQLEKKVVNDIDNQV